MHDMSTDGAVRGAGQEEHAPSAVQGPTPLAGGSSRTRSGIENLLRAVSSATRVVGDVA